MPLGQAAGGAKPRRKPSGAKAFWRASDFTFIGGFKVGTGATGLTHRYVNGEFWLYMMEFIAGGFYIVRAQLPSLAQTVGAYQFYTNRAQDPVGMPSGGKTCRGLYYDAATDTFFATRFNDYDGSGGAGDFIAPILSFNVDHDTLVRTNTKAAWNNQLRLKGTKGFCSIPTEYQAQLGGRRMAMGFGGYQSIISQGYTGPAAAAVDPQHILDTADEGTLSQDQLMMAHPHNSNYGQSPFPGLRDRNIWTTNDGAGGQFWQDYWPEGYGYMSIDSIGATGFWHETAIKKGFCLFYNQAYNGEQANIVNAVEDSATGTGPNDDVTYTLTLDRALADNQAGVGCWLMVPNTVNNYNRATVQSITNGGLTVQVIALGSSQQNGGSRFQLDTNKIVYFGNLYYEGSVGPTFWRSTLHVYDPDDLVANTPSPTPLQVADEFIGPVRYPQAISLNKAVQLDSVTYDAVTNRLYVLNGFGQVGVYQVAS